LKKRIAIVFFGQPRNIQNRISSVSHKFWGREYELDFYGHCWFDPTGLMGYSGGEHAKKFKINTQTSELLKNHYPGIDLNFEKPKSSTDLMALVNLNQSEKGNIILENPLLPVFISQFYSINQALRHFDARSLDREYEFILLSRYDNFISFLPKAKNIEIEKLTVKQNSSKNGFPDLVFIGSRCSLEGINVYPLLSKYLKQGKRITPELLKQEHFLSVSSEQSLSYRDFEVLVVRDSRFFKYLAYFLRVRLRLLKIKLIKRKLY
jgi:hypothetical protein